MSDLITYQMNKHTDNMINILQRINTNLEAIDVKLGNIEKFLAAPSKPDVEKLETAPLDVITLLSLPDHLRKTAMAISKLGEGMAEDVAGETGRTRAIESGYLNNLIRMGYVRKKRKGKKVIFYVEDSS